MKEKTNVPVYSFSSLLSASKCTDENVLHIKWQYTLEWIWIKCILMQMTLYTKNFNNETKYHSIYHKHETSYILTAKRSCAQRTSHLTQHSNIIMHTCCIWLVFFLVSYTHLLSYGRNVHCTEAQNGNYYESAHSLALWTLPANNEQSFTYSCEFVVPT